MAEHPYRAGVVPVEGAPVVVAEMERAPRGVHVRVWSDGTTRIKLRMPLLGVRIACFVAGISGAAATIALPWANALVTVPVSFGLIVLTLAGVENDRELTRIGEEIEVTSAALMRRRTLATGDVYALPDTAMAA